MSMVEPAVVVQKAYDWTLWVIPKAEKFPRCYRFTLGERLVGSSLELCCCSWWTQAIKRATRPRWGQRLVR